MKQFIKELEDKTMIDSHFLVREKNLGLGKNGRPFMSLQLGDNSGYLDSRIWDRVDELSNEFEVGDIVHIKGQVQVYLNRKQIIVHKLDRVDAAQVNMDDFVAKSSRDPLEMYAELLQLVQTIQSEPIKRLIIDTLEDSEIRPLFIRAPAAKSIHHAWVGGLVEHVLSMTKLMIGIASHYDFLNKDLLIFGAIFHDLGKIYELSFENTVSYTDKGRLLGHMAIACELIDRKSSRILGFSESLRDILKHIVLSHHGKLEYGSPKRPKFIEAMIVAMIDDLDSKVSTIRTIMENERISGDRWSKYSELFERYFLLDNLKELE